MQIQKRTMGWLPKPSAYNYAASLTAKRRAVAKSIIAGNEALATSLTNATSANVSGTVNNAIESAVTRLQTEAKARITAQQAKLDSIA